MHNDFPTCIPSDNFCDYVRSLDSNIVVAAIWTSEFGNNAAEMVARLTAMLNAADSQGRLRLAIEDIGFAQNDDYYARFDFSQYAYCSLTWNRTNDFAGGAFDTGGLTDAGKRAITSMCKCGCALDVAHLNRKSFYMALDCAERVLCSHTGFNSHPRSLNGEMIRALIARNGIIGLCTVTKFTDAYNAESFAETIDRFVQKYGDRTLCIGTDFFGSNDIPNDVCSYELLEHIRVMLSNRGYCERSIDRIFYLNAHTFFRKE